MFDLTVAVQKAIAGVITDKILDKIEGEGKKVIILGDIPIIGDILFRYHEAGRDLDCDGVDAEYCRSLQQEGIDSSTFSHIPEIDEAIENKNQTFKK